MIIYLPIEIIKRNSCIFDGNPLEPAFWGTASDHLPILSVLVTRIRQRNCAQSSVSRVSAIKSGSVIRRVCAIVHSDGCPSSLIVRIHETNLDQHAAERSLKQQEERVQRKARLAEDIRNLELDVADAKSRRKAIPKRIDYSEPPDGERYGAGSGRQCNRRPTSCWMKRKSPSM